MTIPSGAGASDEQIEAVIAYLTEQFPGYEINHLPEAKDLWDRFRVVRNSEVVYQLGVWRKFFTDTPNVRGSLESKKITREMREQGGSLVVLRDA